MIHLSILSFSILGFYYFVLARTLDLFPSFAVTSTDGITDRPGHRGALGLGEESTEIFTGTRWTTLTKLPVAFSGGRRLNTAPLPG
jgi:hypothetical protein